MIAFNATVSKIRLPEVEHPKAAAPHTEITTVFAAVSRPTAVITVVTSVCGVTEGHVTPNENEYQISLRLKFRYCLGQHVPEFTVSHDRRR